MQFVYYECKDEAGMMSEVASKYTEKVDNKLCAAYIIALICINTTSFQWHQSSSKLKWKIFPGQHPSECCRLPGSELYFSILMYWILLVYSRWQLHHHLLLNYAIPLMLIFINPKQMITMCHALKIIGVRFCIGWEFENSKSIKHETCTTVYGYIMKYW